MEKSVESTIRRIHETSTRAVIYVTGGASTALSWLAGVPGASRTLLTCSIPYSQSASNRLVGKTPSDSYSGLQRAIDLSRRAYKEAAVLTDPGDWDFVGVSAACALATDRPKKGEHKCFVAVNSGRELRTCGLELDKGRRSRFEEDEICSRILIGYLGEFVCGVSSNEFLAGHLSRAEQERIETKIETRQSLIGPMLKGEIRCLEFDGEGIVVDAPREGVLVLPGSFNPVHDGHLSMMNAAEAQTGLKGLFELTVLNPDKGLLDESTVRSRVKQFVDRNLPLVLTRASLFRHKADLFRNSVFVIGYDTAVRILDPKYYGGTESSMVMILEAIRGRGCKFLVAGRVDQANNFKTLVDIDVPTAFREMFLELKDFRLDISSTEIRNRSQ